MVVLISPLLLAAQYLLQKTSAEMAGDNTATVEESPYQGPEFVGYDCYQDPSPVRFQLPSLCRDKSGHPVYGLKDKYVKHKVNLFQLLETYNFEAQFCALEESSHDFLCGWQSWGELLSPPRDGVPVAISPMACKQMWSRKVYVDEAYGKSFPLQEGQNVFAYQARGSLQVSGESVWCSGSTGRISTGQVKAIVYIYDHATLNHSGEIISKSMLFKSVRVTLGRLKGRREFSGKGRAVITEGELAGTAIEPDQVTGRALVMGQVTIILGSSYFKSECPLAVIRQGLTMYKVPVPGSKSHKLTARPGDRMYGQLHDTERELGTPNLRPWVLLLSQASDLVINLGEEFKTPQQCGGLRGLFETSHAHIIASLDSETEVKDMDLLPVDLELVSASDYSARLDLLSYLTSVAIHQLENKEAQEVCLGDPKEVFEALRRTDSQSGQGRRRYLTAGEMIIQAQCTEVVLGHSLLASSVLDNCTGMLAVRKLNNKGILEGQQWWLAPSTRYISRSAESRHCQGFYPAFRDSEGVYWEVQEDSLVRADPQPRSSMKLASLQPEALPDLVDSVAGGKDIFTREQREKVMEELDFSVFLQGPSSITMQVAKPVYKDSGSRSGSAGSSVGAVPGWAESKGYLSSSLASPLVYLWNTLGAPLLHFLVTIGSFCGLALGISSLWRCCHEMYKLIQAGGRLRGQGLLTMGADALALGLSATTRQARIREAENQAAEQRILYSMARGRRGSRAVLSSGVQSMQDISEEV